ncbi:MAG: hypothetical protein U5M51_06350 [Emticicia sp.]|nr:hypothetical protein [Emticicia sp.]
MNYENNYTKIVFDNFPFVKISIKDHTPTDSEFDEFLSAMKETYANKKNRIVFFDLVEARNVPLSMQVKFAKWSLGMEPNFAAYLKGVTFHVSNNLIKSILKSIFFLQKPNYDYKVATKLSDAESHHEAMKARV